MIKKSPIKDINTRENSEVPHFIKNEFMVEYLSKDTLKVYLIYSKSENNNNKLCEINKDFNNFNISIKIDSNNNYYIELKLLEFENNILELFSVDNINRVIKCLVKYKNSVKPNVLIKNYLLDPKINNKKIFLLNIDEEEFEKLEVFEFGFELELDLEKYNLKEDKDQISPGLLNPGCICYLNSYIQFLYFLKKFVFNIYNLYKDIKEEPVILEFVNLFNRLYSNKRKYEDIDSLINSLGISSDDLFIQQDIQEFSCKLLDIIENICKKYNKEIFIKELFEGELESYIKCVDIDYKSSRKDNFFDIQLKVMDCNNIYDSLNDYLTQEKLEGDNAYLAEGHGKQTAIKGIKFNYLSDVLVIHLRRFEFDMETLTNIKINTFYELHEEISLNKYVDISDNNNDNDYVIFSIFVHIGNLSGSGHYVNYMRPTLDNWYEFNDEIVTEVSWDLVKNNSFGGSIETNMIDLTTFKLKKRNVSNNSSAYMVIYLRRSKVNELLSNNIVNDLIKEYNINFNSDTKECNNDNMEDNDENNYFNFIIIEQDKLINKKYFKIIHPEIISYHYDNNIDYIINNIEPVTLKMSRRVKANMLFYYIKYKYNISLDKINLFIENYEIEKLIYKSTKDRKLCEIFNLNNNQVIFINIDPNSINKRQIFIKEFNNNELVTKDILYRDNIDLNEIKAFNESSYKNIYQETSMNMLININDLNNNIIANNKIICFIYDISGNLLEYHDNRDLYLKILIRNKENTVIEYKIAKNNSNLNDIGIINSNYSLLKFISENNYKWKYAFIDNNSKVSDFTKYTNIIKIYHNSYTNIIDLSEINNCNNFGGLKVSYYSIYNKKISSTYVKLENDFNYNNIIQHLSSDNNYINISKDNNKILENIEILDNDKYTIIYNISKAKDDNKYKIISNISFSHSINTTIAYNKFEIHFKHKYYVIYLNPELKISDLIYLIQINLLLYTMKSIKFDDFEKIDKMSYIIDNNGADINIKDRKYLDMYIKDIVEIFDYNVLIN